jgi:hypothetical protein
MSSPIEEQKPESRDKIARRIADLTENSFRAIEARA